MTELQSQLIKDIKQLTYSLADVAEGTAKLGVADQLEEKINALANTIKE